MSKKRGQGEGSIFEESPGKWRASVSRGWRNGKRLRKTFTVGTRREVQDKTTKALRDLQLGVNVAPERETLGRFLNTWLQDVAQGSVHPKTFRTYSALGKSDPAGLG